MQLKNAAGEIFYEKHWNLLKFVLLRSQMNFSLWNMQICLTFWKSWPTYANKRYAYKKHVFSLLQRLFVQVCVFFLKLQPFWIHNMRFKNGHHFMHRSIFRFTTPRATPGFHSKVCPDHRAFPATWPDTPRFHFWIVPDPREL